MKWSINASEIWSETLSGCPSETDSDVNKYDILFSLNYGSAKLVKKDWNRK